MYLNPEMCSWENRRYFFLGGVKTRMYHHMREHSPHLVAHPLFNPVSQREMLFVFLWPSNCTSDSVAFRNIIFLGEGGLNPQKLLNLMN